MRNFFSLFFVLMNFILITSSYSFTQDEYCSDQQDASFIETRDDIIRTLKTKEPLLSNINCSTLFILAPYFKTYNYGSGPIYYKNLGPFKIFTGLTKLGIGNIQYGADFSFLGNLRKLKIIDIWNTEFLDIAQFKNLVLLEELQIYNSYIVNEKFIGQFNELKYLLLTRVKNINDLSFITNLSNLEELLLVNSNIGPIQGKLGPSIKMVSVVNSNLNSLDFLVDAVNLNYLHLNSNAISSLNGLENVKNLLVFSAPKNLISDLSIIADNANLQYFDVRLNPIDVDDFDESKCPTSGVASKIVMDYCGSKKLAP